LYADLATLMGVVLIDLVLAADNAVAVGLAAAALPEKQRARAVLIGIAAALLMRIGFALVAVQLLQIKGLLLVGGLLLFWVAWRMWNDLHVGEAMDGASGHGTSKPPTTFFHALVSIIVADVSMSLDNVLSVAALARHSPAIMAFGLILSVVLMGVAATFIARIINQFRWIAILGVGVIVLAGIRMVWEDAHHFLPSLVPPLPGFVAPPHPPA
jgi:YjbE family integral membrane protein